MFIVFFVSKKIFLLIHKDFGQKCFLFLKVGTKNALSISRKTKECEMMISNIGIPGLIIILIIALMIFGPKKLPEIGRAFGQTLKEFKNSTKELTEDFTKDISDELDDAKKQS